MVKRFIKWLSQKPEIFNTLRRLVEFNFVSIKNVIKEEFQLDGSANFIPGCRFLDVPCGTGEFSMLFHPDNYIGIDISQEYIEFAQKAYNRIFYVKDARNSGFDDYYFDNILILGLFHHLDINSITATLKEAKRILKENGKLLCIEDSPVDSIFNFIGKILQRLDVGDNIRPHQEYEKLFRDIFRIKKYYPLRSGFWQYSIFVLLPIN